jgi:hypothetical protein
MSTVKSFCDVYVDAPITEYGLLYRRIAALPLWLRRIGYDLPLLAACNDATAILPRVRWRATDDAVFGAAVPDDELHRVDLRAGTSVNALLSQLAKYGLATQVEVFLVGPLDPRAPRFVIGVLAQTAGATAPTTTRRWTAIEHALQQFGLHVVCTGVDGGGSNVAAQHQHTAVRIIAVYAHLLTQVRSEEKVLRVERFPALSEAASKPTVYPLLVPSATVSIGSVRLELPVRRCVQDPVHLVKKLVNPACDANKELRIGNTRVSMAPLLDMCKDRTAAIALEGVLKLRPSDLTRPDRQDFRAAQRLLDPAVHDFLVRCNSKDAVTSAELTCLIGYLKFARAALDSYLNPKIGVCERIERASYALFFAEVWLAHLNKGKGKLAPHFISHNVFAGLRLNAEFLFVWACVLVRLPSELRMRIPFAPWLFGSQSCEEFFRLLRSMIGHENFDSYDLIKRVNRLQAGALLKAEGIFVYPESKRAWNFDEICKIACPIASDVTVNHLQNAAMLGCVRAQIDFAALVGDKDETTTAPLPPPRMRIDEELGSDDDDDERLDIIPDPVRPPAPPICH